MKKIIAHILGICLMSGLSFGQSAQIYNRPLVLNGATNQIQNAYIVGGMYLNNTNISNYIDTKVSNATNPLASKDYVTAATNPLASISYVDSTRLTLGVTTGTAYDGALGNGVSNTAYSALSRTGGTMTGSITMGTNAFVLGVNAVNMFGGTLNGTNGVYWRINGTNHWILFP